MNSYLIRFATTNLAVCVAFAAAPLAAESRLAILPGDIRLSGPKARQRLVIERIDNGRAIGEVAGAVAFSSSDPNVVTVKDGFAVPVANGNATIVAMANGQSAEAVVKVVGMEKPFAWSFRNHVQSVLTKGGCNSGACHGALAGKKGLKLSLRGYDAEGDYNTLTRQARGRRITLADPGRSLVLLKPTTTISHGGGQRFAVASQEYNVLAEWIAAGAPPPRDDDPRIDHVEILPPHVMLKRGDVQQLLVRAFFTDGHVEDVTRWAKFTSANGEVATVDDHGKVTVMGEGEGALTAWYLNKIGLGSVTVPYRRALAPEVFSKAPRRNFIDVLVLEKLQELNLPPSPRCTDSEFIRRAYLDTLGVLPAADEARAFLADTAADKRDKLIERLIARPEYVDYWSYKFSDLLLVSSERLKPPAMWAYYNWIRNNVAANTPWDVMVRNLVTAQGSTLENGATNFFVLHPDALETSETISQAFLGMSINCARCHNHPLEKWTNKQYYSMANLVSRVRLKDGEGDGNNVVFSAPQGDVIQPLTGKAQPPQPLDGPALPLDSAGDRRAPLADWLTSPDNPYFTRAIANRVWANYLGVGVVEKVDDLRLTNPASNPKLLAGLAKHLVENKYDLQSLMRTILHSQTYQASSRATAENAADRRFYSHRYPRRLMAEVMLDAISQVTESPTQFAGYPLGWRALQLPDAKVASYFLQTFGRPDRTITCECERTNQPSVVQALHLANGDAINKKLEAKNNRIDKQLAANTPPAKLVEDLYLCALSRHPTKAELDKVLVILASAPAAEKRTVIEDLYWGVLSSKEFLFNR